MVQHPRGDRAVEGLGGKRQRLDVADPRIHPARHGELDHPLGLVECDDGCAELPAQPLGELARPAAHFEHLGRVDLRNGGECELSRIVTFGVPVGGAPILEAALGRVLLAHKLRIVEAPHAAVTITWPGIPRRGGLPPSQALMVAPTSANSPSWMRPAAFFPSTYATSSACSREWSVDGVVGSQPWSERQHEEVARLERVEQVRQPPVEVLQAAVEVDRIVAMAPEHVRLDEVGEDETAVVDLAEQPLDRRDPLDVRLGRVRLVDVEAREDVVDLPDAVDDPAGLADQREVVRLLRLERPVVPVGRSCVRARFADERPGDDPPHRVLAGEDLARDLAGAVQLLERNRLLVSRDLEDRVGRGVDDPLPGALMLLTELLDDLRARRGLVAEDAAPVRCMKGSITSCGKPCPYVGIACGVTTPISSQCPVVVSLPLERSTSRPATAGAPGCGGQPSSGSTLPRPSASRFGRSRPPTARATFPSVSDPSSPYSSASGSSPAPTASRTITHARAMGLS